MNTLDITKIVEPLSAIAAILEQLGLPGLVMLALAGPALVICSVLFIEYQRSRKVQDIVEQSRAENRELMETYRSDTRQILRELGGGLDRTAEYYRNNLEMIRQYERMTKGLQDVVVSNTRAMERLITMIEAKR